MGRTGRARLKKRGIDKPDDHDENVVANLYKHLASLGWKNETSLACRNFSDTGRGLCSKKSSINQDSDTLLIKLPIPSLITLYTIERDQEFKSLFNDVPLGEVHFQALLAIYLLYHKHQPLSPLQPYIASIPTSFTNPNFCNRKEFYYFPTNILQGTVERSKKIRNHYSYFQKALSNKRCPCCDELLFPTLFSIEQFEWAFFAINSRSVFVEPKEIYSLIENSFFKEHLVDSPQMGLAPFLDLFNHSDKAVTNFAITASKKQSTKFYELHTQTQYKAYEQIFISYGALTNAKLLLEYGFFVPENAHDYFEITLSDIEDLIKTDKSFKSLTIHRNKFKFIREHNLNDQMFVHSTDGLSHNLKVVLYLIFKETSHFPNILNQTAFGASDVFEGTVDEEAELLLRHKHREYQSYKDGFEAMDELSASGKVVQGYVDECLRYLDDCLNKFF